MRSRASTSARQRRRGRHRRRHRGSSPSRRSTRDRHLVSMRSTPAAPSGLALALALAARWRRRQSALADASPPPARWAGHRLLPVHGHSAPVRRGPLRWRWPSDAAPAAGNGRLVVISHGSGGTPWVHADLARALVDAGFSSPCRSTAPTTSATTTAIPGPTAGRCRPAEVVARDRRGRPRPALRTAAAARPRRRLRHVGRWPHAL